MTTMDWGSDAIAAVLRSLDLKYAALVPGASYRGLHDSIVNYLGNENPEMLLCLHEEHSVAIAHGYAKVTGKTMLAIVHSNVGLMHATMAIFNAWCDRVPVLILGANGPVDAMKRRPWIDWIHTSQDMGALVRSYTKWDDQPGSAGAAIESILRARQIAMTAPNGPTIVFMDAAVQEGRLEEPLTIPPLAKYEVPHVAVPSREDVDAVLAALRGAKNPVIIAGRCAMTEAAWDERVALAETVKARVVTRTGAMFPTDHPLHAGTAGRPTATKALQAADVILDLDVLDLAGVLKQAKLDGTATVISCSVDRYIHNGWSMDYQMLPAVDVSIGAVPDTLVSALIAALGWPKPAATRSHVSVAPSKNGNGAAPASGIISIDAFSAEVGHALDSEEVCISRLPQGADERYFTWRHPLDYLGGGGGRRPRRRAGHCRWRGTGVARNLACAGGRHGRRRFPDGRYGALDGRREQYPAARHRREQSLVLQRRSPSRASRHRPWARSETQMDRPTYRWPRTRSRRFRSRARRGWHRPHRNPRRHCPGHRRRPQTRTRWEGRRRRSDRRR